MPNVQMPVFAVSRLRMGTDGRGVTTLVCARGCPLRCRHCMNPQSWQPGEPFRSYTPRALCDSVQVDDLYFQATGGGVTFGGGEPLLYADFIRLFRRLSGERWRITVETCLNLPSPEPVRIAACCVDEFIVDVKDMNPDTYRRYTGGDIAPMLANLELLLTRVGPDRVLARVPAIPGYNGPEDVDQSVARLKAMGVTRFDRFAYVLPGENPRRV